MRYMHQLGIEFGFCFGKVMFPPIVSTPKSHSMLRSIEGLLPGDFRFYWTILMPNVQVSQQNQKKKIFRGILPPHREPCLHVAQYDRSDSQKNQCLRPG